MREDAFRTWMKNLGTMGVRPIGDAISRCKRIVNCLHIDLDVEYAKDCGESIIAFFEYSANDVKNNKPAPMELEFKPGANVKNGMASLKAAAKKYFEFCQSIK